MTTIAWDGKWLAADRMGTYGNAKRVVRKIIRGKQYIYAMSGTPSEGETVAMWLQGGAEEATRPIMDEAAVYGIAVRRDDGEAFMVEGKRIALIPIIGKWSVGSGSDFALAAMARGDSAPKAVAFAARFDVYTGLGVDKVRVG